MSSARAILLFVLAAIMVPLLVAWAAYTFDLRAAAPPVTEAAPVLTRQREPLPVREKTPPPVVDRPGLQRRINAVVAAAPITFLPNSATLTPAGVGTVRQVAGLLREASPALVEVDGHVAGTPGRRLDPQALSDQRATTVRVQLLGLGVEAGRVLARGLSDSKPIAPNTTAAGQAANRRVEIVVL